MMTSRWHGSATSPTQCKWAFISEWQDKTGVLRQGDTSSSVPAESLHRWTGGDAFQLSSFSMNSSAILVGTSRHLENRCAGALYALSSPHSDSLETALDCTAHYYTDLCDVCVQSKAFSLSFFWRDVGDGSVKASDPCRCVKMCVCLSSSSWDWWGQRSAARFVLKTASMLSTITGSTSLMCPTSKILQSRPGNYKTTLKKGENHRRSWRPDACLAVWRTWWPNQSSYRFRCTRRQARMSIAAVRSIWRSDAPVSPESDGRTPGCAERALTICF